MLNKAEIRAILFEDLPKHTTLFYICIWESLIKCARKPWCRTVRLVHRHKEQHQLQTRRGFFERLLHRQLRKGSVENGLVFILQKT